MNPTSTPGHGTGRRPYQSPVRQQQAEQTRRRILDTARELFRTTGYAGTTIEAIASGCGVAVPTVYAAFGSKRLLLAELVRRLKDEVDVPARARALMDNDDPRQQLRDAARLSREFAEAAWDVVEVLRASSKSDAELSGLYDEVEGARLRDQRAIVDALRRGGRLTPGLSTSAATDLFWAISATDLYRLLVVERGWSARRYERWLADTLAGTLLAPRESGP